MISPFPMTPKLADFYGAEYDYFQCDEKDGQESSFFRKHRKQIKEENPQRTPLACVFF